VVATASARLPIEYDRGIRSQEGVYLSAILVDRNVGIVLVVSGIPVPLVLIATWRQRRIAYLVLLPCLALGAAGYAAMLLAYGWWTGV
jgi:hypothetical protein